MHLSIKLGLAFLLLAQICFGQSNYKYHIDLRKVTNDQLTVELETPAIRQNTIVFSLPKIIPGTYKIADYGAFVHGLKAFTAAGDPLTVKQLNKDQWQISNAAKLHHLSYQVEDVFDTRINHEIYPMAATDINAGEDYVMNLPGFLGYFDGMTKLPFEVKFDKPEGFYASTAWQPSSTSATADVFKAANLDDVYDQPIMYTRPDTATVQVGNCQVLVSVYAPHKMVHAKEISVWLHDLLDAARQYLGGKLPADRYAFLYYFRSADDKHSFPEGLGGALEHTTSSFYYLGEAPAEYLRDNIVDISSHEFFHIITPLTIASREVKEFNFDKPVMSKHLWLYEGVTEYTSHHVQVKYDLNTPQQFLTKLSEKINLSKTAFNDRLPFTELSLHSTDNQADQYGNVYQKGALIAACLDLYLLKLSKGNYGLRNLTYDLGVRYGRYRYFNDDELFDVIGELTYPEITSFLKTYVGGSTPIPYTQFFDYAGVRYDSVSSTMQFTFGGIQLMPANGSVIVGTPFNPNSFGKKMGYKEGDIIQSINGKEINASNAGEVIAEVKAGMQAGQPFIVKVGRRNASGKTETVTLTAPAEKVESKTYHQLSLVQQPTAEQELIRNKWLHAASTDEAVTQAKANPADVASIDAIVKAMYDVISGAAGPKDWPRFQALFTKDAKMGAVVREKFMSFTPADYQRMNQKVFETSGFYERELKRKVTQFGNIVHVETSYEYRFTPDGKVEERGVNYLTLIKSDGRWFISNLIWQDETDSLKLGTNGEF